MTKTYSLYYLKCPIENIPRYIGITDNPKRRLKKHLNDKKHKNYHKDNWIKKLQENNLLPEMVILLECDSRETINRLEIKLISEARKLYGDKITNISDGGDGIVMTQEIKDKISKAHKGRKLSDKQKETLRKSRIGKKMSDAHKEIIRKSRLGSQHTKESKLKMSESVKKRADFKETLDKARINSALKTQKTTYVFDTIENIEHCFESRQKAADFLGIDGGAICIYIKTQRLYKKRFKVFTKP